MSSPAPPRVELRRRANLFAPLTALHRMDGDFGAIAKSRAPIVSGPVMRYAIIACGALVFFILGASSALWCFEP